MSPAKPIYICSEISGAARGQPMDVDASTDVAVPSVQAQSVDSANELEDKVLAEGEYG